MARTSTAVLIGLQYACWSPIVKELFALRHRKQGKPRQGWPHMLWYSRHSGRAWSPDATLINKSMLLLLLLLLLRPYPPITGLGRLQYASSDSLRRRKVACMASSCRCS